MGEAVVEAAPVLPAMDVTAAAASAAATILPPPAPAAPHPLRMQQRLAHRLSVDRHSIFRLLVQLAGDNEEHFGKSPTWSSYGARMMESCSELHDTIPQLEDLVTQLQEVAPRYDYDEKTPGNGYRSLVCIADTVLLHLVSLFKMCTEQRGAIMFRLSHVCKEIEAYATVVRFLNESFRQTLDASSQMPAGSLFPPLDGSYDQYHELLRGIEKLDSSCFYGRPLGFQFSPSVSRIFRFIGVVLATYSLSWERGHGPIGSILNSGRFFLSPEQRASRIIKVIKEADINFCKGFWNLSELGNNMPKWFCPNMAINELREVNWTGAIPLSTTSGGTVSIPEPSAHTPTRPVKMRVLSFANRNGVSRDTAPSKQPLSPHLLFHCHGGGYVATSSKSHETYLRVWAKQLNCTVVSIEYSLAPENPFPRPTEECLYAYAWIINNPAQVGWTGDKLAMVGDSAGGNLVMSLNLRLIQLNVARKPDGIVPVYTPFLFQYLPSPSRLLAVMDPLLHMGIVLRCVAAYTGGYSEGISPTSASDKQASDSRGQHKSLQEYVEQVQKTQRIDFAGGSQFIVSLLNLANGGDARPRTNVHGGQRQTEKTAKTEKEAEEKREEDDSGGEEIDDDNLSLSSVQVDADPLHIHLSTIFDSELVTFLKNHPTTRSNVVMCDENGEPVDEAMETEESAAELLQTAPTEAPPASSPTAAAAARSPIRLGERLINGVLSAATQSTPSTPLGAQKPLPSSTSNNNFLPSSAQPVTQKRSLSQSLADTAVLAAGHAFDGLSEWLDRPVVAEKQKLERATSTRASLKRTTETAEGGEQEPEQAEDDNQPPPLRPNVIDLLSKGTVPRDPLISPMYASDEMLRQLPPLYLVACHLDPLLDDTICFARRLRAAGGSVASVDLLPAVPHGFLNFTLMSPECRESAKLCLHRIRQALGMPISEVDEK